MTKYNVHIYREMRLFFGNIEAGTHEAAAAIARDKTTGDADDIEDCNGDDHAALVDVIGDEDYSQSVTIDFEAERQCKAAPKLTAALKDLLNQLEAIGIPDWHGAEGLSLEQARDAIAEAEAAGINPVPVGDPPAGKPFSILLLYPDYANDSGTETYYAFVEARDQVEAVEIAQRQAVADQDMEIDDPADFAPLLVTEGHRASEPLFNK
jgi:hypothetical protein